MKNKKKLVPFWQRSITTQYSIGYFLLLFLMLLIFLVSFLSGRLLSAWYEKAIAQLTDLNELYVRVEDTNKIVYAYYTYFSQSDRDAYQEQAAAVQAAVDHVRQKLQASYSRETVDLCYMVETYLEKSQALMEQVQLSVAGGHISMEGSSLEEVYQETQDIAAYIGRGFQAVYAGKLVETEAVQQSIHSVRRALTAAQLIALTAAVAICFAFYQDIVHGITLSVNTLTAFARRVTQNPAELQEHVSITTGDELELLAGAFNEMIDTIHDQMDRLQQDAIMREQLRQTEVENLQVTAALQASQMTLLQNRINPHFLFNTLNMITQTAHMEGAEETAEMMEVTAEMMRYHLGRTTKPATLRAEIQNTRNYVYIQRCRFGSRIAFEFDIDESCLELEVPCLIVQPLVENAITHGVGPLVEGGRIAVRLLPREGLVSVNHRLNILGYLDLSEFGEKYANSANAGHADLVAALEWIRDNIAAFGGDPGNVTLFGQSGGGEKIQDLMNIPAADGLFHKGIIQSGATKFTYSKADGGPLVRAMLDYLGLRETEAEQLEILPYPRLVEAYKAVARACYKKNGYLGCSPAVNGWYLGTPQETGFTEHARTIPLMVGSVMGEFCFEAGVQNKYGLTEAETMPLLEKKYGALAGKIAELFKAAYPGKHLSDALYLDTYFRVPTRKLIRRLAEEGKAPVYAWRLTYDFPIDGGKVAWHCSDVPFAFHNTCRTPLFNVPGETDRLEERICGAFVSFARYGDPNTGALPAWPPCTAGDEATMIFDKVCEVRHNFDNALVDTLEESGATPNLPMADTLLGPEDGNAVLVVH